MWAAQSYTSYVVGQTGTSSWTDTTTTNVNQRFYKVERSMAT